MAKLTIEIADDAYAALQRQAAAVGKAVERYMAELLAIHAIAEDGDFAAEVDLTPAQAIDLDRRIEECRSGNAELVSGDEAFEELRKRSDKHT